MARAISVGQLASRKWSFKQKLRSFSDGLPLEFDAHGR